MKNPYIFLDDWILPGTRLWSMHPKMNRLHGFSVQAHSDITTKTMDTKSETYQKGLTLLNQLHGGEAGEQMVNAMKDICPDFATMTIEWAMAGIMARPGLDLLTREYVVIASCVTLGHPVPQLKAHIAS